MMRQTYLLLFLIILFISNAFGQNENDNCPPLFTRSKIKISKATITRIEVVDSNKFTKLPEFVLSLDSLSKLIKGPEIAARAGVTGDAIIKIKINFNGYVSSASILRGIGAGYDEATLEVLMKSKFHPAKIGDEKAESEIKVWVNFYLIEIIDEPDIYIDEIKYEVYYNLIKNQTVLKFNKIGEAYYFESQNYKKVSKKEGNIPLGFFTKLNDFIISQCFQNYKYRYNSTENFPEPVITITVKIGSTDYYVTFRESDNIPVGLWALNKLILHVKDHIQWKEVKE